MFLVKNGFNEVETVSNEVEIAFRVVQSVINVVTTAYDGGEMGVVFGGDCVFVGV